MDHDFNTLIPESVVGKAIDLEHSINTQDRYHSSLIFAKAVERLLKPSGWHELAGKVSASFALATPRNTDTARNMTAGDYVSVNIPAPGNKLGDGVDWVRVEIIARNFIEGCDESFGVKLRASANPDGLKSQVAHFFDTGATSTFIVRRDGLAVTVSYHGRNEVPNNHTISTIDNIRNTVVATGAAAGFSNLQWDALLKGLLQDVP